MRKRILIAGLFLAAIGAAGISLAAAPTRYPVELKLRVQGRDSHKPLHLPAQQGYSYEVKEQLSDIAVLRVFNPEGQALDGYYEVTNEDLRQLMKLKIDAGLKAAASAKSGAVKCETCQVGDAEKATHDRRPAIQKPVPAEPNPSR